MEFKIKTIEAGYAKVYRVDGERRIPVGSVSLDKLKGTDKAGMWVPTTSLTGKELRAEYTREDAVKRLTDWYTDFINRRR